MDGEKCYEKNQVLDAHSSLRGRLDEMNRGGVHYTEWFARSTAIQIWTRPGVTQFSFAHNRQDKLGGMFFVVIDADRRLLHFGGNCFEFARLQVS